jgi:hypothetical protein
MVSLYLVGHDEAPADKLFYGNAVDQNVCPLASLKMLISKTDPNAKSLFNRCIKDLNVNDAVWGTMTVIASDSHFIFVSCHKHDMTVCMTCVIHCLNCSGTKAVSCVDFAAFRDRPKRQIAV